MANGTFTMYDQLFYYEELCLSSLKCINMLLLLIFFEQSSNSNITFVPQRDVIIVQSYRFTSLWKRLIVASAGLFAISIQFYSHFCLLHQSAIIYTVLLFDLINSIKVTVLSFAESTYCCR